MERKIARFSELITIQRNETEIDVYQNHRDIWSDYFSCHAYPSTYQRDESEGAVTTEERSVTFEVRYCTELQDISSDHYRILFHDEIYNITSVDMMNYQKQIIRLQAERTSG